MAIANAFNSNGGTAGGDGASSETSENISSQIDGSKTTFTTSVAFENATLKVYWNGVRQFTGVSITPNGSSRQFTTTFTPAAGQNLFIDYVAS